MGQRDEAGTQTPAAETSPEQEAGRAERTSTEASSSTATGSAEEVSKRIRNFITDASRSALYHQARESFLGFCHRTTMFLVIVSSSASVAAFTAANTTAAKILALIPAILTALDIAIGFSSAARHHAVLARRFMELAAQLSESEASAQAARSAEASLYRLYAEEPPHYYALNALCHNQLADSVGADPSEKLQVKRRHRLLRHLIRFSATDFPRIAADRAAV